MAQRVSNAELQEQIGRLWEAFRVLKEQLLKAVNTLGTEAEGAEDARRSQFALLTALVQCLEERGLVTTDEVMARFPKTSSELDQLFAEKRDRANRDESTENLS
jgi:hypothetical protein